MKKRTAALFVLLAALSALCVFLNVFYGSADISFRDVLSAVTGKGNGIEAGILLKIRIPRTLSALILGGGLALSGYLLQTFFHNPIAGPFVLGVSSGAKLTVALAMIAAAGGRFVLTSAGMIGAAFAGSLLSLGTVLLISRRVRDISTLVVCGVMIGYMCSAVTDLAVTFAEDSDIISLRSWSMGSFSGMTMDNVRAAAALTLPALILSFLLSKPISAFSMGENSARALGVNVMGLRVCLILLSGLLSACVAAFAGPVSFLGIAVPHIIRVMFATSKPAVLIPACFLGGGICCMLCDMLARSVFSPDELSISTVTAFFGAPVVVWIMIRRKRGEA